MQKFPASEVEAEILDPPLVTNTVHLNVTCMFTLYYPVMELFCSLKVHYYS